MGFVINKLKYKMINSEQIKEYISLGNTPGFSFTNCDTSFSVNYRFRSVESYKIVAYEEI